MANVYNYINTTGLIVPDSSEILAEVQSEYVAAFGADLQVNNPNSPQGLLINAETQARIAVASNNATLANQINPSFAGGVYLDDILALMGGFRIAQSYSRVYCTITGINGTIIPSGSQAQDVYGGLWQVNGDVTIPLSGTITGIVFTAINPGPLVLTPGDLNLIVNNVLGWETITNPAANYITGTFTQSDASARQYRTNILYLQGNSLAQAVVSGLNATVGVNSVAFLENPSSSPATIGGVTMAANSIYACVDGGDIGTPATILCTLGGTDTTVIPAGSVAQDESGNLWVSTADATISGSSIDNVPFSSVATGVFSCPPGTLDIVVTVIVGWDTITNPTDTTPGTPSTIAQTLAATKSAGAAYNNGPGVNIVAQITIPFSNQIMDVLFDTPNIIDIGVTLSVIVNTPIQDPISTIKNAILNYANGLVPGFTGLIVNESVSCFEISGAITAQYPGIYIDDLQIENITGMGSFDYVTIPITAYQKASITANNITVNIL